MSNQRAVGRATPCHFMGHFRGDFVLWFYSRDSTRIGTQEACRFRGVYEDRVKAALTRLAS
jgi:peroxiredoxin